MFGEIGLEALCQFAPREHDASSTAFTFETNIRAEACDGPFVGAAGMLFTEAEMIVETEVGEHGLERMKDEWQ